MRCESRFCAHNRTLVACAIDSSYRCASSCCHLTALAPPLTCFGTAESYVRQRQIPVNPTGIAHALTVEQVIAHQRCVAMRDGHFDDVVEWYWLRGSQLFEIAKTRRLSFLSQPQFLFHKHGMRKPNVWNLVTRITAGFVACATSRYRYYLTRVVIRREN